MRGLNRASLGRSGAVPVHMVGGGYFCMSLRNVHQRGEAELDLPSHAHPVGVTYVLGHHPGLETGGLTEEAKSASAASMIMWRE